MPDTVPSRTDAASIRFLLPERGGVVRQVVIPDLPGTHGEVHLRPG
ncbi:hypothetical protein ACFY04_12350 [Streptomyces sp. NPDC001549]